MCLLTKKKIMCLKKNTCFALHEKPHSSERKHALVYHYAKLAIEKTY